MIIQNKCCAGERPYKTFLTAIAEGGQEYLSDQVKNTTVRDKDWATYKSSFTPLSVASSSAAVSPFRTLERNTMTSDIKQEFKERFKTSRQCQCHNSKPNVSQDIYQPLQNAYSYGYEHNYYDNFNPNGFRPLSEPFGYHGHHGNALASTMNPIYAHNGDPVAMAYSQGQGQGQEQGQFNLHQEYTPGVTDHNVQMRRKQRHDYEPSYKKSPYKKNYRLQPSSQKQFAWTQSNPEFNGETPRHSSGVVIYETLPENIYQATSPMLHLPPQKALLKGEIKRDSKMTIGSREAVDEIQITMGDEDFQPGAAATVGDFSQSVDDIAHLGTRDADPEYRTHGFVSGHGSNLCESCGQIYMPAPNPKGTVNASMLTPRSDTPQSTDYLNRSTSNVPILPQRQRNKDQECCTIL